MPYNFHPPESVIYILTRDSSRWRRVVDWEPTTAGLRQNIFLLARIPGGWYLPEDIRAAAAAWPPRRNLIEPSWG